MIMIVVGDELGIGGVCDGISDYYSLLLLLLLLLLVI